MTTTNRFRDYAVGKARVVTNDEFAERVGTFIDEPTRSTTVQGVWAGWDFAARNYRARAASLTHGSDEWWVLIGKSTVAAFARDALSKWTGPYLVRPTAAAVKEAQRYDEDNELNDPNQRCKHGTFIGSWSGPDLLCGPCEDGE